MRLRIGADDREPLRRSRGDPRPTTLTTLRTFGLETRLTAVRERAGVIEVGRTAVGPFAVTAVI